MGWGVGTEEAKTLNEGSRVMKENLQLSQQGYMLVLCIRTSDTWVRTPSILLLLVF